MAGVEAPSRERLPVWLSQPLRCGAAQRKVSAVVSREGLNTVCTGARCPNRGECYSSGTATFMIMGDVCTRGCRFCAVEKGVPAPLRVDEPEAVARAGAELGLDHVVVTSVTRDDLPDGGAGHFARTIEAVRVALPGATVEVLVPDFMGDERAIATVVEARPDVFNHNVETVRRLYDSVRPGADYARSLEVLSGASGNGFAVKSGFMVGLGESCDEVDELLEDLRDSGCDIVTAGQYLRPTVAGFPVARYWEPSEFEELGKRAVMIGIENVAAGPLVRSSYRAGEFLKGRR